MCLINQLLDEERPRQFLQVPLNHCLHFINLDEQTEHSSRSGRGYSMKVKEHDIYFQIHAIILCHQNTSEGRRRRWFKLTRVTFSPLLQTVSGCFIKKQMNKHFEGSYFILPLLFMYLRVAVLFCHESEIIILGIRFLSPLVAIVSTRI